MNEIKDFNFGFSSLECTKFLEFAESLKIPINPEYLQQIRGQLGLGESGGTTFVDVGVKDSKNHESLNERRLQNALWRAWWRQRKARFNAGSQSTLLLEEENLETMEMAGCRVWGKEIGDIPTEYSVKDLQGHELPVIGTYVDPNVLPGFRYRVRVCGGKSDETFIFDGKALRLLRVGPGYGKRLSFEDEDILANENFFWSDSNPDGGFAFSIEVLSEGEKFTVFDCDRQSTGDDLEVLITQVDPKQKILSSHVDELSTQVTVSVKFQCRLLRNEEIMDSHNDDICVCANITCLKPSKSKIPTVTEITGVKLDSVGNCILRKNN